MNTFKIVALRPELAPMRSYDTDAGFDLKAAESRNLAPGQRVTIDTGVVIALTPGWEAQIRPRSGLALKHGITIVNSPGTVDAGYRGPLKIILLNTGTLGYTVKAGDRIAQMVIKEVPPVELELVDRLPDDSDRGTAGFGSTGTS